MLTDAQLENTIPTQDEAGLREPSALSVLQSPLILREKQPPVREKPLIEEEVIIEEVSIDGMCGVY